MTDLKTIEAMLKRASVSYRKTRFSSLNDEPDPKLKDRYVILEIRSDETSIYDPCTDLVFTSKGRFVDVSTYK